VLAKPARGGKAHWHATSATITEQVHLYAEGRCIHLVRNALAYTADHGQCDCVKQAQRLVPCGCFSKACHVLLTTGDRVPRDDALETMKAKNPSGDTVLLPPEIPTAYMVGEEMVHQQLHGFARGTSFGSLGAKDTHLLELVEANPGCLRAPTQVVNHILKGQAPLEVAPYFAGGNLHAIPPKLRPVVVGNLFSQLVSRCANASAKTALREYLEPHQLVVSSLGAEAWIHAFC
jgi:hypothetical protein